MLVSMGADSLPRLVSQERTRGHPRTPWGSTLVSSASHGRTPGNPWSRSRGSGPAPLLPPPASMRPLPATCARARGAGTAERGRGLGRGGAGLTQPDARRPGPRPAPAPGPGRGRAVDGRAATAAACGSCSWRCCGRTRATRSQPSASGRCGSPSSIAAWRGPGPGRGRGLWVWPPRRAGPPGTANPNGLARGARGPARAQAQRGARGSPGPRPPPASARRS